MEKFSCLNLSILALIGGFFFVFFTNGVTAEATDLNSCVTSNLHHGFEFVTCFKEICGDFDFSVLELTFDPRAKKEDSVQKFKTMAASQTSCSQISKFSKCVVDTIRQGTFLMANGTKVEASFFQNKVDAAMVLVPGPAFCEASEDIKQLFYEFLNEGGQECITNPKNFVEPVEKCLLETAENKDGAQVLDYSTSKFLQELKRCVPPLIRQCTNGEKLEPLFSQTIPVQLEKVYENLWKM